MVYHLKFQNLYKSDLQWLRGIGWLPSGSVEDEKNKIASQILSDHVYRQHPDQFKFSSLMDSIPMVLAKNNAIHSGNIYSNILSPLRVTVFRVHCSSNNCAIETNKW